MFKKIREKLRGLITEAGLEKLEELNQQVVQLYQEGKYQQAVASAKKSCELTRRFLGEAHPDFAASLNNLARLYKSMGDYAAAEPLYHQAIEVGRTALGETHSDFLDILNNPAEFSKLTSDYAEAGPLMREAIRRKTVGEAHPEFARSLHNLATLYQSAGNYVAAEPLYREAIEVRRTALGEQHPDFAMSLNNLAILYHSMGDYAAAETLMRQALEIRRIALGEQHPDFATSLGWLALLYRKMGNYAAAEPFCRQEMEINRKVLGEAHPDFARSLNSLALLYNSMGDYAAAEPLLRQVLEIHRTALGEAHPDFADSLNNLAMLYHSMGNYTAAEPLLRQVLEIHRTALGEAHPDFADSLGILGGLYKSMGNYAAAELLLRQAMEIPRAALGEAHPDFALSLNGLAMLYQAMGNYAAAEPLLRQAAEIHRKVLGEQHPDFALSLNNLAVLYQSMGNYAAAEPLCRQAVEIDRAALGETDPLFATSLSNLATLHQSMGNYAAAEPLLRQAMEIQRTGLSEMDPLFATNLSNLAMLHQSMGNYAAAEPLLRQALEIQRTALGEAHPDFARSLNNLAGLCATTNRMFEALRLMEQSMRIEDRILGQVFSIGSESQRTAYLKSIRIPFDLFLSLVSLHLATSPDAVRSALALVLRRKAVGAEALAAQRDAALSGQYPALASKLSEITVLRSQIAQKTLTGPGLEGLAAHQKLLDEWTAQKERLEAQLARQIPEMNLEQKMRVVDRQAVALALPERSVLVEFVRFRVFDFNAVRARGEAEWQSARYLAFILPANEPDNAQMLDLGEAEPIDWMIATFREAVSEIPEPERGLGKAHQQSKPAVPVPVQTVTPDGVGVALRQAVFDPLLPFLGSRTRLLVSPDGDLARLPLEVLPTDDGRYLLDQYQISYLSAGRDVLRFGAAASGQPATPMVVADPDFDLGAKVAQPQTNAAVTRGRRSRDLDLKEMHFGRLAGTQVEGTHLARRLGVQPVLAGQALEQFVKECRSPRILHLATHGFFLPDQPRDPNEDRLSAFSWDGAKSGKQMENPLLRSGLALAGANWKNQGFVPPPAAEDGLLTAEDVSGLDLLATDLVVLSACETGLGEIHVGEGVFGLRRAFVLAGAKTLVMSLWSVPDLATAVLMERFYDNLLDRKMPRYEALREAQIYTRSVTMGEIRAAWLTADKVDQLAAGDTDTKQALWSLARQPDAHRPFEHPCYWGAFICQGEPDPLRGQ